MLFLVLALGAAHGVQFPAAASGSGRAASVGSAALGRRALLLGATLAPLAIRSPAVAAPGSDADLLSSLGASKFGSSSNPFVGTYTDPINHPGGTRTISLLDTKLGPYQLAKVVGGGGRGEPANYELPAMVDGSKSITIDFSPKGGPKDFVGYFEKKDGKEGIRFARDGNFWPKHSSKLQLVKSGMYMYGVGNVDWPQQV